MKKTVNISKWRISSFVIILTVLSINMFAKFVDNDTIAKDYNGYAQNVTQGPLGFLQNNKIFQTDVSEQNVIINFLAQIDERKDYRLLLIIFVILFLIMLFVPFISALRELNRKKDATPLFVSLDYSKDPRFFDHSFRSKLLSNIHKVGIDRCFRTTISNREEIIEVIDAINVDNYKFGKNVLYLQGDAQIKNNIKFSKEVYVTGKTELQAKTRIRAILSEKDLSLGQGCEVVRWIGSEENIYVSSNCGLGARCSCEKLLQLAENCTFRSLYGHPIFTNYSANENSTISNFDKKNQNISEDRSDLLVENWKEIIGQDNNLDNIAAARNSMIISRSEVSIPANTSIAKDLIVKSNLLIGSNSTINGSIKCYHDVSLAENVEINGDIFCDGNIQVGSSNRIHGNLFCQGQIIISTGSVIGNKNSVKSVIGKKGITLEGKVIVHGYVLTEGLGKTR